MSHRYVLVAVLIVLVHACALVDPEEWGEWVPSEIDVHETLERVGDSAYQMLCSAFDGYIHDQYRSSLIVKAACTAHALLSDHATECTAIADACLANLPSPVEQDVHAILAQAGCTRLGVVRTG